MVFYEKKPKEAMQREKGECNEVQAIGSNCLNPHTKGPRNKPSAKKLEFVVR
jgi:hypothetical protein